MRVARDVPASAKRLVVVTGKGGVGKSTVAAALGIASARSGRRTVVVEVAGRADVPVLFGRHGAPMLEEQELEPGLHHVRVDPRAALAEYLRDEVPGRLAAGVLARSRIFDVFTAATPGLRELLTIGKVAELARDPRLLRGARPFDRVVLDAPATGHAIAMLASPRTFGAIAGAGPIARQGAAIDALLRDHGATGVVAVSAPEQLAVSETLALQDALAGRLTMALDGIVVNRTIAVRLRPGDEAALEEAADDPAVRSARWLDARARAQRAHQDRLRRRCAGVPIARLPLRFGGDLVAADVQAFAGALAGWGA